MKKWQAFTQNQTAWLTLDARASARAQTDAPYHGKAGVVYQKPPTAAAIPAATATGASDSKTIDHLGKWSYPLVVSENTTRQTNSKRIRQIREKVIQF